MSTEAVGRREVVITGLGVRGALARDTAHLRDLLAAGRPLATAEAVDPAADPAPALPAAWQPRAEALRGADPAVVATAHATLEAALAAGLPERQLPPDRLGVVLGGSNLAHRPLLEAAERHGRNPAFVNPRLALTTLDSHAASVVAAILGAEGPVFTVGAAAASGAAAVVTALDLVRHGRIDACLAIGAMQRLSPVDLQALRGLGALPAPEAARRASRPFDAISTGVAPVEMAAALVLEAGPGAGGRARARLLGGAITGGGPALPSPSVDHERRTMLAALADAGLPPETLDAVLAHATGTAKGDLAEARAIEAVLGGHAAWVLAPKAVTGHALTAAGALGAVEAVLMLEEQRLFPQPPRARPIETGLRMPGGEPVATGLCCVLVNAFGFGSLGAALVLGSAAGGD